jgi:hypothetical protein
VGKFLSSNLNPCKGKIPVMKTLFRTLLYLSLIVWLGAEIFFPVVAAITFQTLAPNTHTAGIIVGGLLRILHGTGFVAGLVALALLALTPAWGIYRSRVALSAMVVLVLMLGLTAFSQFGIIPAMERDRIAAGGAIDRVPADDPNRMHFNKLHNRSESVEAGIMLLGILVVVLVARAETTRA